MYCTYDTKKTLNTLHLTAPSWPVFTRHSSFNAQFEPLVVQKSICSPNIAISGVSLQVNTSTLTPK